MEKVIDDSRGIKGMLVSFRKIMQQIEKKETIAFLGLPYTCTPLIDFLLYVIRDMGCKAYYVPQTHVNETVEVALGKYAVDYGNEVDPGKVDVIVLLGGLAMPNKETLEDTQKAVQTLSHEESSVVGMCFMNMFERAGWMDGIPFAYMENCYLSTTVEKDTGKPWKVE